MPTLKVALASRAYDIAIGAGFLTGTPCPPLMPTLAGRRCLVVADARVAKLYGADLHRQLLAAGAASVAQITFRPGEAAKSLRNLGRLYDAAVHAGLDRGGLIVALGGGVSGDLAGFMAATFMRGLDYLQVPTTLLAQVDSSVGGKTGINLPSGKNLVGAFHQPRLVVLDVHCLRTLSARQLRCGLAEVVKYGVIMDEPFFGLLEDSVPKLLARDEALYTHVIHRCCELKARLVVADEYDTLGKRAILNYGHTFGHALENLCGYGRLTHGEAVAIGMGMAVDLAHRLAPTRETADLARRQDALLTALGLPIRAKDLEPRAVLAAMATDKKNDAGRLRLILCHRLGEASMVSAVPTEEILRTIGGRCVL